MRQFIKEHPWRLEIVPGFIVVFAIVWPQIFRSEIIATQPWKAADWLHHQIFYITFMLGYAFLHCWMCHMHARCERGKKYFFYAPLWTMFLCWFGSMWFDWHLWPSEIHYDHISPSIVHHSVVYTLVWLILIPVAGVAQAVIEWIRPFRAITIEESVPGASDIRPGDPFYYREVIIDWIGVIFGPLVCISLGYILWLQYKTPSIWSLIMTVVLASVVTWLFVKKLRVTYVISKERILCHYPLGGLDGWWHAGRHFSIKIADVKGCSIFCLDSSKLLHPYFQRSSPDYMRPLMTKSKFGTCLKVETNDGKAYLLGLKNPETACKLINTALEARKQSEGQA
jgi:hypothetical protein